LGKQVFLAVAARNVPTKLKDKLSDRVKPYPMAAPLSAEVTWNNLWIF
jgi:hypothetical protein